MTARPLIKVCGITEAGDAAFCEACGVDLLGFIFHPASPRYVSPETAVRIKTRRALRVGVFGEGPLPSEIKRIMTSARLDLIQLHGGQDKRFCRELGPERIIKVLWPQGYETLRDFQDDMEQMAGAAACFLFDSGKSGGGHGRTLSYDFTRIRPPRPWFLAGGLDAEKIKTLGRYDGLVGFDFNSGVEAGPGRKDPVKVRLAVAAVAGNYAGKHKAAEAHREALK